MKNFLKISKLSASGTIYGIVSAVGSGKTTLLNILSGVTIQMAMVSCFMIITLTRKIG